MRITNNMMLRTTASNINANKLNVNSLNNQMSSQKKISRPSEDPVVAIRALRLRSNLSEINQYYEKNIPDAEAWLEVTETALNNMESILSDVRTQCNYGATGTLKTDDRKAILTGLTKLREQLYAEGNSDNAGRTVFTGYRTNSKLTFMTEEDATYEIEQMFSATDIEKEHRYFKGEAVVPADTDVANTNTIEELERMSCDRIRIAYGSLNTDGTKNATTGETDLAKFKISYTDGTKDTNGNLVYKDLKADGMTTVNGDAVTMKTYATMQDWKDATADFSDGVTDNEVVVIAETGEILLGKDVSTTIQSKGYSLSVSYEKTGFSKGELRPEYYFNCKDVTDAANPVVYTKYDGAGKEIPQDIEYTIAVNQTLTINTNASDVFNADAGRDVDEMIDAVQYAMDAHDKISQIEAMMALEEYAGEEDQKNLQKWLDAATKEADYADDNLKKLYNTYIGKFDSYLTDVRLAITTVGSKGDQLELTENRMSNQQLTVEDLKSSNEDRELSDIIIDYTSAFTAYQGALQAASKINQNTLIIIELYLKRCRCGIKYRLPEAARKPGGEDNESKYENVWHN